MKSERAERVEALKQIYEKLQEAEWQLQEHWNVLDGYRRRFGLASGGADWEEVSAAQAAIEGPLKEAFLRTLVLLESMSLPHERSAVEKLYETAKLGLADAAEDEWACSPYLVHSVELRKHLGAIGVLIEEPGSEAPVRELAAVLRRSIYSITEKKAFGSPPRNETDVHEPIEAILKCFYPDCSHKPAIATFLKNFEPDTGILSLKTLIEYKYADTKQDARNFVDQLFADVAGYSGGEYERLFFVIYETERFFSEEQWKKAIEEKRDLLVAGGGWGRIEPIVLPGVPPPPKPKRVASKAVVS